MATTSQPAELPARGETQDEFQTELPRSPVPRWRPATRIAFRFCFVYFTIYCLTTQIIGGLINIPNVDIPDLSTLPPLRPMLLWVAAHIFHISQTLIYSGSGSGDKTFDWSCSGASCSLQPSPPWPGVFWTANGHAISECTSGFTSACA